MSQSETTKERATCPSCGHEVVDRFCSYCGEKQLDDSQRTVTFLFQQLIQEITSLDGKLYKTLKLFFLKPGYLCSEFRGGARKPYLSPITLFFIFNLLYFVGYTGSDFKLTLIEQTSQIHQGLITPTIKEYLGQSERSFEEVADLYDVVSPAFSKSIIIVGVPFFALLIWLINFNHRYYLQDHLVYALNIYGFVLVWEFILSTINIFIVWLADINSLAFIRTPLFYIGFIAYLWLSQKCFYHSGILMTTLKTLLLFVAFAVSHFTYRFIQFWLIWWQVA